jgi:separase
LSLDPRILELFISLDEAKVEYLDVDECVLDLLYFVVDVLQFNGECNAYDEVDFDSMVVEIVDAIKAYHSASIPVETSLSHHVILILDKNLHCIPWESLPTWKGVNISRLPSLEALRRRILFAKAMAENGDVKGHRVGRSSGASLINPSGDLKTTEEIIQPLLHSLPNGWSHSSTQPSEQELLSLLSEQELYLYFGHGSGNQFIRHKSVRGLQKCPTTWLMGCSSAAITLRGDYFEPEALLLAYIDAGAPAVVGALWDITDRDCDRASVRAGTAWGLWQPEEGSLTAKLLAKKGRQKRDDATEISRASSHSSKLNGRERATSRGKARVIEEQNRSSLVEAIRIGRDECYLKYLNGAAIVVYGITVFLDD